MAKRQPNAMLCTHANEVPTICPCPPTCYCRVEGSCKDRAAKNMTGPSTGLVGGTDASTRALLGDLIAQVDTLAEVVKFHDPVLGPAIKIIQGRLDKLKRRV